MKIKRTGTPEQTIEEFAEAFDLTMEIVRATELGDYVARFDGTRIKGNGCIYDIRGRGNNEQEAIADYVAKVSGHTLVFREGHTLKVWRFR